MLLHMIAMADECNMIYFCCYYYYY